MATEDDSLNALLFEAIVSHSENIIGVKDLSGRYLFANVGYARTFGQPADTFLGRSDRELFPSDIATSLRAADRRARFSQSSIIVEETVPVNGEMRTYLSVKFPIHDTAGKVFATGLIATDVSQWRKSEEQLRQSEELFRQAFENATIGMCLAGLDGVLLRVNPQLCRTLGYERTELEGHPLSEFTHIERGDARPDYVRHARNGDAAWSEQDRRYRHKDGHDVWCKVSSSLVKGSQGEPLYYISHVRDITESRQMEAELKRLASTDPLTGIANRRSFFEHIEQELQRLRRMQTHVSCLMLDIDHFKTINDRFGHPAGDEALRFFTMLCQQRLRITDVFARLGGEEFAILMPGTPLDGAVELAEQIRQLVGATPVTLPGASVPLTVSIGVTALHRDDNSPDAMLRRADAALYQAKTKGRNRVASVREAA
ncbi:sensor domain-containing diguanylate cyclase [Paludibacterium paludis]|uniref:PAS domain S-box-containing protein/diguanylate cyclase (GGDEF)-like protein n=1 Tax=Paludibacterium paludis TaxID=1225769 RepID=A0A918UAL4_9NEIS|nr:GGDEF domain-containing protein [Paludibacterium paludis]GGY17251.1 hypothetical protein GCM10011289_20790 [Paludibacterium paludis]